jgi:alkaline phosphatase D
MKIQGFALLLSSVGVSHASWAKNLNYRSPSEHHPGLGIAIHKVVKRSDPAQAWDASQLNFTHGVASGDPYPDSVILWTRAAPTSDNDRSNVTVSGDAPLYNHDTDVYVKASAHPMCVDWKVATDKCFSHVVSSGQAYTSSDIDWTIKVLDIVVILPAVDADFQKVEAKGLKSFTEYYYQFNVCNSDVKSPVGRTKTTPGADEDVEQVSLAVYSCSNYRMDSSDYALLLFLTRA